MPAQNKGAIENAEASTPMSAASRTSTHLLITAAANRLSEVGYGALRPESDAPLSSEKDPIRPCNHHRLQRALNEHALQPASLFDLAYNDNRWLFIYMCGGVLMLGFGFDLDPQLKQQLAQEWNARVRSIRTTGFVVSILMIVVGVLCLFFPIQSIYIGATVLTFFIIAFGVFEIAEYLSLPAFFRMGGMLASGILNIVIGIMLLALPAESMVIAFSFMLAFNLLMLGVEELSFTSFLRAFNVANYGWVIASSVLNIIFALMLLFIPITSSVALWLCLALYLVAGGISLLIECVKSKNLKARE